MPLETALLQAANEFVAQGVNEFHGLALAKRVADRDHQKLVSTGAIYKAMRRLEMSDFFTSRWENQAIADESHRPRRRMYTLTAKGMQS